MRSLNSIIQVKIKKNLANVDYYNHDWINLKKLLLLKKNKTNLRDKHRMYTEKEDYL